jgi:hypothetical protein
VWNLVCDTEGRTQTQHVENKVLKRIFGSKMDEIIGGCRNIHSEEPHNLYNITIIVLRRMNGKA